MKKTTIITLFLLINLKSFCEDIKKFNLVGEIAGNGMIYSLGFEHCKIATDKLIWGLRYGAMTYQDYISVSGVFVEYNKYYGKSKYYFENGYGTSIFFNENGILICGLTSRFGYRYMGKNADFRVGLLPCIGFIEEGKFKLNPILWVGVSISLPLLNNKNGAQ